MANTIGLVLSWVEMVHTTDQESFSGPTGSIILKVS
jgi:hypothetical protein